MLINSKTFVFYDISIGLHHRYHCLSGKLHNVYINKFVRIKSILSIVFFPCDDCCVAQCHFKNVMRGSTDIHWKSIYSRATHVDLSILSMFSIKSITLTTRCLQLQKGTFYVNICIVHFVRIPCRHNSNEVFVLKLIE